MSEFEVTREMWDELTTRVAKLEAAGKQLVPTKAAPRTRGHRLPEAWTPAPATVDKMCRELNVPRQSLYQEHNKFKDYFLSAPGEKGVKLDWDRTWCNWMRTACERGALRGQFMPPTARRSNDDKIRELMERDVASGQ